ncbi:30S ribosomal protein S20 [Lacunimicrobium album]
MPNTNTAKRGLRKAEKRRLENRSKRSMLRTLIKRVRTLAADGNQDEAKKAFIMVQKRLDQASAKNLVHANTASRLKSRLNALLKRTFAAKAA